MALLPLLLLSGLQLAATLGVGALLWRRLDRATAEIQRLRTQLGAAETAAHVATRLRVGGGETVHFATVEVAPPGSAPRSIKDLRRREKVVVRNDAATLSPETARALVLAIVAIAPAIGFFFAASAAPVVATGIVTAAAIMLVGLRPLWRAAAWAGVIAGFGWALTGFALGAATDAANTFAPALAIAGGAGLAHAHMRRAAAGMSMAFVMGAAALALGVQIGLIGAAGIAFGALVVGAAIVGAMSFRLESVHLAAFAAALVGLFTLSGQHDAAIWFTPVATWVGAVFLGIAVIRVPDLGARGLAIAGTGTLAPLAAIAALYGSGQGLAAPWAGALAFLAAGLALSGVIVAAARREGRGIAALGLTLWTLACGAWFAMVAAILIALPAPVAASAFALLTFGLAVLDQRAAHAVWRLLAWLAAGFAAIMTAIAVTMLLNEARGWAPAVLIVLGTAAPAALFGGAAYVAERRKRLASAALFEALAIVSGVIAANLTLRTIAAHGAILLAPIAFAEAGLHIAVWLGAALALAARSESGARHVRRAARLTLVTMSLAACATAAALWLTPHWSTRNAVAWISFSGLGFLAPAALFLAHWMFWRRRNVVVHARTMLAAGAVMAAAFAALITLEMRQGNAASPDWLGAGLIALAFALATGVNFVPGAASAAEPGLKFGKNFHRPRRGEMRSQAR